MKVFEHTIPSPRHHGIVSVNDHGDAGIAITTRSVGGAATTGITITREQAVQMAHAILDHIRPPEPKAAKK